MPISPPMPPVTDFHSEKIVTASICSPSEAATKYSPRTRNAGSASASEMTPLMTMPASVATAKSAPNFIAGNRRRVGADAEEDRVREREDPA